MITLQSGQRADILNNNYWRFTIHLTLIMTSAQVVETSVTRTVLLSPLRTTLTRTITSNQLTSRDLVSPAVPPLHVCCKKSWEATSIFCSIIICYAKMCNATLLRDKLDENVARIFGLYWFSWWACLSPLSERLEFATKWAAANRGLWQLQSTQRPTEFKRLLRFLQPF